MRDKNEEENQIEGEGLCSRERACAGVGAKVGVRERVGASVGARMNLEA